MLKTFVLAVAVLTLLMVVCAGTALAAHQQLLSPSQLNPDIKGKTAEILDSAFNQLTGTAAGRGRPTATAPRAQFVTDPYTHKQLNAMEVARFVIAVQQLYLKRTGHKLTSNTIDLDSIATNVATSVRAPAARVSTAYTVNGSATVTSIVAPHTGTVSSAVPSNPLSGHCNTSTESADPSKAIADQWAKIEKYDSSPSPDPCSLQFGNLLETVAGSQRAEPSVAGSPQPKRSFNVPPFGFGNPTTAYGVVRIVPLLAQSNGSLIASLTTTFDATVLNGAPLTLLNGVVSVTVPSKTTGSEITSDVTVKGGAFSNDSIYHAESTLGPSKNTYTGKKTKDFEFWSFSKSWIIPIGLASTTVTARASVSGNADLSYQWEGDSAGMYATASPSVGAVVSGSVGATNVACSKCTLESKFSIQNSDSSINALLARVPYGGAQYAVQRLYAIYKPATYQATIEAYGHLMGIFYFHQYIMKSPEKTLGHGFSFDSGWIVQPLSY